MRARSQAFEPWLERNKPYPAFPEPLNRKQMKNASKALDCISCMCCYSACPVIGLGDLTDFAGPAPLVQLGQTALDPRNDPEKVSRSLALTGIFNCVSCYKCEEVCPASIPIVSRIIEPLKAKAARLFRGMARHSFALRDDRRGARTGRSQRAGAARAGACGRWRICRGDAGCCCAARSIRSKHFFGIKTAGAEAAGRILVRECQMKFAYYPGCSARSTCAELNEATHLVAASLASIYSCSWNRRPAPARVSCVRSIRSAFYTLNVRILALAESHGLPLMTICNTCTLNVLDAHAAFVTDEELAASINAASGEEGLHYSGRTRISHFLWVLYENIGEQRLRELVVNPLTDLTVGVLRLPHHAPAAAIRLRRFAQQHRVGETRGAAGLQADRLQRPQRMLRVPHRRP
jgi:ferredoxin